MLDMQGMDYRLADDLRFLMETENKTADEIAKETGIAQNTLSRLGDSLSVASAVREKLYAYAYARGYRLNSVKEDLLRETSPKKILFHGSRSGLKTVDASGSRKHCDFGHGFYLSEAYDHALSFVCEHPEASVYSFACDTNGLRVARFECDFDWMLAICYHRGTIAQYADSPTVRKLAKTVEDADVVIAPIADNKMFYIMSLFAEGDLNAEAALHSLSAAKLGLQYVFKTDAALAALRPVERYYLCEAEKAECRNRLTQRGAEIDTKLKLSRRSFRDGPYIEELLT